jgi:hypothetical protein
MATYVENPMATVTAAAPFPRQRRDGPRFHNARERVLGFSLTADAPSRSDEGPVDARVLAEYEHLTGAQSTTALTR